jgi:hypothetical protein
MRRTSHSVPLFQDRIHAAVSIPRIIIPYIN